MMFNLLILVEVLALTWMWSTRGFFSSLLHLVCVVIAGAVAFAFWEPIAIALLPIIPSTGFIGFLEGIVWTIALLVPFALTLAILRFGTDALVKGNVKLPAAVDYLGAGVCGVTGAMITAGLIVIAFGYLRMEADAFGYKPLGYASGATSGSLERRGGTWVRAEKFTAGFYGMLSKSTLSTSTPLGTYYPDLDVAGYANKMSYRNGAVRNALSPADVSIAGWYTVATPDAPQAASELMQYREGDDAEPAVQSVAELSGETITQGHVAGFVVRVSAGAKEDSGQVILGQGQIRLIAINRDNPMDGKALYPVALITRSDGGDPNELGRWKFDGPDVFVASPQAESSFDFTYEFLIPAGYEAKALTVKNVRLPVQGQASRTFASSGQRDSAVNLGGVLQDVEPASSIDLSTLDTSDSITVDPEAPGGNGIRTVISRSNQHGFQMERRQAKGLTLNEQGRIMRGTATLFWDAIKGKKGGSVGSQNVLVREFSLETGTAMVQVNVSVGSPVAMTSRVLREAGPRDRIRLVGANGIAYDAIGYIYEEEDNIIKIRYEPGSPLAGKSDIDTLSSSRQDQTLRLLFAVDGNTPIVRMIVGERQVASFNPPLSR